MIEEAIRNGRFWRMLNAEHVPLLIKILLGKRSVLVRPAASVAILEHYIAWVLCQITNAS
jgi:hypothetical protein